MNRSIARALVLAAIVLAAGTLPLAGAEPREDCSRGFDTTSGNPIHLGTHGSCSGRVNECDDPADYYTFTAGPDDLVELRYNARKDPQAMVAHLKTSPKWYSNPIVVYHDDAQYLVPSSFSEGTTFWIVTFAKSGWFGGYPQERECAGSSDFPHGYSLGVTVHANAAPVVDPVRVPDRVILGEPEDVTFRLSDPDGNGAKARYESTYRNVAFGVYPVDVSFTDRFAANERVTFGGRDAFGASTYRSALVEAGHDDCGLLRDAGTETVGFPFACHGSFWAPDADRADTYAFSVPEGAERLYADWTRPFPDYAPGNTRVRLVDSAGALVGETVDGLLIRNVTAPGNWTFHLDRASGSGSYDVHVRPIGPPAPPALTATPAVRDVHQGDPLTLAVDVDDPNGERTHVTVDWGDGTGLARHPASGMERVNDSVPFTHTYRKPVNVDDVPPNATRGGHASTVNIAVRAENEETLNAVAHAPVNVTWHHDCAYGPVGTDASGSKRAWYDGGLQELYAPATCGGELGYALGDGVTDDTDIYEYRVRFPPRERVTLTLTEDEGLEARLSAVKMLGTDITYRASGDDPDTLTFVPVVWGDYLLVVDRASGRGAYTLTLESEPLVGV